MMAQLREFLNGPSGRYAAIGVAALVIVILLFSIRSNFRADEAIEAANNPVFICSKTGKTFRLKLTAGLTIPVDSPFSGEKTGYLAEPCYWNTDGTIKSDPTYVLLNQYAGRKGATFCPDCGRRVVGQNPFPQPGTTPPPTQSESDSKPKPRASL